MAFGAVYDWALWPLTAGAIAIGSACLARAPGAQTKRIFLPAAPLIMATLVQVLPLPEAAVQATGAGISHFLANYDFASAVSERQLQRLSISPSLTLRAAVILTALAVLIAGLDARLARRSDLCRRLAFVIAVVALPIALFALIQKATFNGKIYWFWESEFRAAHNYFGPFVNRNHFAGWMLLAAAVTGGFLIGQIQTMGSRVKVEWRDRLLWLSGEEASRALLTTAALLVMLISIMWSMSRSGILGTALALILLGAAALRRLPGAPRKVVAAGAIVLLLSLAVTWRGADTLANWYGRTQTFEWRVQIWKDTVPALTDFWIVGSGLNTYSRLMLLYPQNDRNFHAAQAHSDYVQLAVEGGVLVGIPALILLGLLIREIRRRLEQPQDEMTWWIRMGAVAGICGMALQETVEFSLQISGIAVLFAVLVAIAIHKPAPPSVKPSRSYSGSH